MPVINPILFFLSIVFSMYKGKYFLDNCKYKALNWNNFPEQKFFDFSLFYLILENNYGGLLFWNSGTVN